MAWIGIHKFPLIWLVWASLICIETGCRSGLRSRFTAAPPGPDAPQTVEVAPASVSRPDAATPVQLPPLATSDVQTAAFVEPGEPLPGPATLAFPATVEPTAKTTLEELEQIALANNPTLRMAASQVEKERGNWTQAGLWPNPVAGYLRSDPDVSGQSRTSGGFVQQTFVTAGKLQLAREQEAFGIRDACQGLEAQRQRVLNDVRMRHYETLGAQHTHAVASAMEKLASEGLDFVRRAERAGEANPVDAVRAEMQLKRMQLAVRQAKAQATTAWQNLMNMVGTPDSPPRDLAGSLDEDIPQLDAETQWQSLLSESPLLVQLSAQVAGARKAWELALAQRVPDVTGQVVVESDSTQHYTTVQTLLAVPIPLFNRNQGGIHTAWHELRRAQAEIERTQLALRDAFEASFRSYANALDRVETTRDELLPAARKSLALASRAAEAGELALADVLDARQVYFDTQLEYAAALTDLRVAAVEVQGMQLTGGLNPAEIGTAIQSSGGTTAQRRALQQLLEQQQRGKLTPFTPGTTGE
jgi:cobalt-zinc-cadmium efflux system outer membrane protein